MILTKPVSGIIVDTSVWIDFLNGKDLPDLEDALKEGSAVLSPLVWAELLSGTLSAREERSLNDFLEELPLHATPASHWIEVGRLRRTLLKKGLSVSVPDAHIAQCSLEIDGSLFSFDGVFPKIAEKIPLRLVSY